MCTPYNIPYRSNGVVILLGKWSQNDGSRASTTSPSTSTTITFRLFVEWTLYQRLHHLLFAISSLDDKTWAKQVFSGLPGVSTGLFTFFGCWVTVPSSLLISACVFFCDPVREADRRDW